ncbi:G-type lectin S-receptor-like serine/threonine-protein kinase SD2-5 [Vitis riparia]|uniref:G-type lectin S-receptor-like serine/threonine-protein kinase SD2-5 n=1 Tax=Vitis riparia TaxID=96939 RepID=UPI00155A1E9B|nr:G-type lectin S-receptor-like serine/threonine-protein kinase SD2-5 [Vitis riparia]
MDGTYNYGTSLFLKVQTKTGDVGNMIGKKTGHARLVQGSSLGEFLGVFVCIGACLFLLWKRRGSLELEEDYLDWIQGMPTRFSYHELKASTKNFSCKLGEGGFGLVFEGILSNGMKVAVKHLVGLGQVKKSFLAEVETIGNIHHVNLVRMIGFCAEKSLRLLVYEYMCHGSLDKLIFHRNKDLTLGRQSRKKITLDCYR